MKNYIYILLFVFSTSGIFLTSCEEVGEPEPLETSGEKPQPVTNVTVENYAGRSKITYTLPNDKDLLYVKASYTLPSTGAISEVRSSYYTNNLTVEGFAEEQEYVVTLVAVNRSEVESDPVETIIKPKPSPIYDVFESIIIENSFGGYDLKALNPEGRDIVIEILTQDELGQWIIDDNSIFTKQKEIFKPIRGLDTVNYVFKYTIRDRWLNYTDTLTKTVKPFFEQLLDKRKYSAPSISINGDAEINPNCLGYPGLWDNNLFNWNGVLQTKPAFTPTKPHVITFSIGQTSKISRVKIWDYPEYDATGRPFYVAGCLKEFEIWGCPTLENVLLPDVGTVDETNPWVLLGRFTSVKPSGLPYGEMNTEDDAAARAGFDWNCYTKNIPKVKYLRIRCIENYLGTTFMAIGELQVYGGLSD